MKILLLEPWLAGSHLLWAEGYRDFSDHDVDVVGLPGELWRWRLRGGALPLASKLAAWVDLNGQPDLLLVSGMVDVAELLGLVRSHVDADVAVVVYQHESQLLYPVAEGNFSNDAVLRNWLSWCAADLVLFNSYYHMAAVSEALPRFLASQPDDSHLPMLDDVVGRFEVLPVGVDLKQIARSELSSALSRHPSNDKKLLGPPVILWPHRWESDKDPAAFIRALQKVDEVGLDFRLVLAGLDPLGGSEQVQAQRGEAEALFADRVLSAGELERQTYLDMVSKSDLVISCARHEFFGVAIVEAVAAGCVPLLPNALSYPELIRPLWHAETLYEPETFGARLVDAVDRIAELKSATAGLAQSMSRFDWSAVAPLYDERFVALVR